VAPVNLDELNLEFTSTCEESKRLSRGIYWRTSELCMNLRGRNIREPRLAKET
jgi:hypothetical protein